MDLMVVLKGLLAFCVMRLFSTCAPRTTGLPHAQYYNQLDLIGMAGGAAKAMASIMTNAEHAARAPARTCELALTKEYQKMCGVSDWKNMSWNPRNVRTRLYSTCARSALCEPRGRMAHSLHPGLLKPSMPMQANLSWGNADR